MTFFPFFLPEGFYNGPPFFTNTLTSPHPVKHRQNAEGRRGRMCELSRQREERKKELEAEREVLLANLPEQLLLPAFSRPTSANSAISNAQ